MLYEYGMPSDLFIGYEIYMAIESGCNGIIQTFIDHGVYCIDERSTLHAAYSGNIEALKILLSNGAIIADNPPVRHDDNLVRWDNTQGREDYRQGVCDWSRMNDDIVRLIISYGFFSVRLDAYKYLSHLDQRHLQHIPDNVKKIIIWRCGMGKRMIRSQADIVIITP